MIVPILKLIAYASLHYLKPLLVKKFSEVVKLPLAFGPWQISAD